MEKQPIFHFSFAVSDLAGARAFYAGILGCTERVHAAGMIEFRFFGHHLVAHLAPQEVVGSTAKTIGTHGTPLRHFGVILSLEDFEAVAGRLSAAGVAFIVAPEHRYRGELREQMLMVCRDGCGNALEFKGLANPGNIFA
jgi:extradiol dioxygenase family protein